MNCRQDVRVYKIDECISFRKTNEEYGGLSNMAPGYKIYINDSTILTSEALYQACRYPNHPEIQKEILIQNSPMTAKMISKKYRNLTRNNWDKDRVSIMKWCLRLKLLYNWKKFGHLLEITDGKDIVENSKRDDFWGAISDGEHFNGSNALGRLLMELREQYKTIKGGKNIRLSPPKLNEFLLLNKEMSSICVNVTKNYNDNVTLFDYM